MALVAVVLHRPPALVNVLSGHFCFGLNRFATVVRFGDYYSSVTILVACQGQHLHAICPRPAAFLIYVCGEIQRFTAE